MATITGSFPDLTFTPVCNQLMEWYKSGGNWGPRKSIPMGSREFLYQKEISALALNWTNRSSSGFSGWHFGPYSVRVTGVPTPVPQSQLIEGTKVRSNNKPFIKKVRRGDIVVSDYRNVTCMINYSNGGRVLTAGPRFAKTHGTSALGSYGFQTTSEKTLGSQYAVYLGNPNAVIAGTFELYYQDITMADDINPLSVGFNPSVFHEFLDSLPLLLDQDQISGLVMENLSTANAATVDILTALAEMPETLVSALNGCQTILKLYKESKKGEFRWFNKAKAVRLQRDLKLEALRLEQLKEFNTLRDAKAIRAAEIKMRKRQKQLEADCEKQLVEITDAISSVWLNFRYNITPNVILIEDCVKAYETFGKLYKRWTKTTQMSVKPPQFSKWECVGEVNITVRNFIKRKFKHISNMSAVLRNFSFNIFKTAYELIPLSFVLDWVIPIGDLLSASLGSTPSEYDEASTISYKVNDSRIVYTHTESGASAEVIVKGYERRVINPYDYCRLLFLPDISSARRFDAVALAWSILRGNTLRNL